MYSWALIPRWIYEIMFTYTYSNNYTHISTNMHTCDANSQLSIFIQWSKDENMAMMFCSFVVVQNYQKTHTSPLCTLARIALNLTKS
jgi:hypothetical protein